MKKGKKYDNEIKRIRLESMAAPDPTKVNGFREYKPAPLPLDIAQRIASYRAIPSLRP